MKEESRPVSRRVAAAGSRRRQRSKGAFAADAATPLANAYPAEGSDERGLRQRISFERFLADLSAEFVNVPSDRVDAEVVRGLGQLAEFLKVDRCSLARFTEEGRLAIIQSYEVPGAPQLPRGELEAGLTWYIGELAKGRVVRIPDLEALPAEAVAERECMQNTRLKSHVGIPINVGGTPLWVLGIATFRRKREFPLDQIPRLQLIGEVFANALARRDADHNLRRMQSELAHVTRVSTVGQLAASIAHEINQPLCAIVSNAQAALRLLAASEPDISDIRAALQEIVADGRRAGDVVSRSHGLLKRRDLEFKPMSLNDVVAEVFSMVHSDAVIRRVTLRMELADALPAVNGDRVQLQQVLLNLIVNALDATADAPDGRRHVALRTSWSNGAVRVTVVDTGTGLTPEVAAQMFEPFFTTKRHGLGMGLAINRSIVQAHNGSMGAASADAGHGASVWFELPSVAALAMMPTPS
jgi:signal transduction histidine kinase